MMLTLALALLLPPRAGAQEYDLTLRFERPGESRRLTQMVRLNQNYNTVTSSSGPVRDSLVVNVMPTTGSAEGRVALLYQVSWEYGKTVVQAQDASELSLREEAELTGLGSAWSVWARVSPAYELGPCSPPSSGGGLKVSLRGPGVSLTRRTTAGARSNVYYEDGARDALSATLSFEEADEGAFLASYRVERTTDPAFPEELPSLLLNAGVETVLPGTDFRLSVAPAPEAATAFETPKAPLSFDLPAAWVARPTCDEEYRVTGWSLDDTSVPPERRTAVRGWGYVLKNGEPLDRRAIKGAERFEVDGGRCAFWVREGMASAACDFEGGVRTDWHLMGAAPARAKEFRRVVGSFRVGR